MNSFFNDADADISLCLLSVVLGSLFSKLARWDIELRVAWNPSGPLLMC